MSSFLGRKGNTSWKMRCFPRWEESNDWIKNKENLLEQGEETNNTSWAERAESLMKSEVFLGSEVKKWGFLAGRANIQ